MSDVNRVLNELHSFKSQVTRWRASTKSAIDKLEERVSALEAQVAVLLNKRGVK